MKVSLYFLLIFGVFTSCLTDLRPKEIPEDNGIDVAKALLQDASQRHGFDFWVKTQKFSCTIRDQFFGMAGKSANPLDKDEACFQAVYSKSDKDGELTITKGKFKGDKWILKDNQSFVTGGSKLSRGLSKKIKFWVPTYKYFIEFPYRIIEADAVEHLGKEVYNGVEYDKVLASWGTTLAQSDVDQYIIWISDSKEIKRLDYTVRDQYKFISGTAIYDEYVKFEGYDVPKKISVLSSLTGDKIMHEMTFDSFEIIN